MSTTAGPTTIERASSEDVVSLATDVGPAPMQVGAVLRLAGSLTLDGAGSDELLRRVASVPRLRQRLVVTPWGCGRPIWVDDAGFDIRSHVHRVECPAPGDEAALLAAAADLVGDHLPSGQPLWRLVIIDSLADGTAAIVVVFHHVLADGIGGLAVLGSLVDGMPAAPVAGFPRRPPARSQLALDAFRGHVAGVARIAETARRAWSAASGMQASPKLRAARTSWNRPTGPDRRCAVVRRDLDAIHRTARAHGATVNDVVLAAAAAAIGSVVRRRGESLDRVVVSVPVSARRETSAGELGNQVGVVPVVLATRGDPDERLADVARATRAAKEMIGSSPTELLGPTFRLLAWLGAFHWFIDRQRLVHTFVTNLRGPNERLVFLGVPITEVDPITVVSGNVTVAFAVLSYAGTLAITIIADPDACPDLDEVRAALQRELDQLAAAPQPTEHH